MKNRVPGLSGKRMPTGRIRSATKATRQSVRSQMMKQPLSKGILFFLVLTACLVGALSLFHSITGPLIPPVSKSRSDNQDEDHRLQKSLLAEALKTTALWSPHLFRVKILKSYPHRPDAFTQGLVYYNNGTFYESTGLYGKSTVREVDLVSGKVRKERKNSAAVFGEGLALWKNKLLQISWQTRQGFIYDRKTLQQVGTFTHPMKDGWGLTNNGSVLFGSDGSSTLYFIDPNNYKELGRRTVTDGGRAVKYLNELEFINGQVWANVWQTDCIAIISVATGRVEKWVYMPELRQKAQSASNGNQIDVLNGIAWDSIGKRLFVTGKLWPQLYDIKAVRVQNPPASYLQDIRNRCIL